MNGRVRKINDIYDCQLSPCHIELLAKTSRVISLVAPFWHQNL
jgi:hypothetical protein